MTKFVIAALPALGALLITISRTEDYRHDVYDVSSGSLIGMTVTYYCYVSTRISLMSYQLTEG